MSNKRILIFSLAYYPEVSGAEIAVKELTDRISDTEFDMITLCLARDCKRFERFGNINVYRIGGGLGYLSKILFIPRTVLFALKLNRKRQYSAFWAIMTYMLFPIVFLQLLGNKTPYVLTLQDGDPFEHVFSRARIFPFLPMLFYGFRHASQVQAISNFLANWARQMGYRGNVSVIPNGVEVAKFESVQHQVFNKESVSLITTSRLVEKNGVGDIIEALKFLPESIRLKILGIGPLEENLKLKVRNLKLESRIEFLGFISTQEIPVYLHDADIFIRPSLSEGQGISFIEAMAAGLPVIATAVGGISDFLKHEETGLFCEVGNPKSIAEQVKRLIGDEPLRNKLISNARKMVVEKYDWNLIANEMKSKVFTTL